MKKNKKNKMEIKVASRLQLVRIKRRKSEKDDILIGVRVFYPLPGFGVVYDILLLSQRCGQNFNIVGPVDQLWGGPLPREATGSPDTAPPDDPRSDAMGARGPVLEGSGGGPGSVVGCLVCGWGRGRRGPRWGGMESLVPLG